MSDSQKFYRIALGLRLRPELSRKAALTDPDDTIMLSQLAAEAMIVADAEIERLSREN